MFSKPDDKVLINHEVLDKNLWEKIARSIIKKINKNPPLEATRELHDGRMLTIYNPMGFLKFPCRKFPLSGSLGLWTGKTAISVIIADKVRITCVGALHGFA